MILRGLFLFTLAIIILHVALPQSETIWSSYETPRDLLRLILGLVAALAVAVQAFRRPRDESGYRTWLYVGGVGLPFALICAYGVW